MRLLSCLVLASLVPLTIAGCDSQACTALGCANGIQVDFSHSEPGSYAVDVTVDGVTTTCNAKLPLEDPDPADACAAAGIYLTRNGSHLLPASGQSIGGLRIERVDAKSVTIRVSRDGQLLRDATFTPSYVVSPEPNGPGCDPPECRSATFAMP